MSWSCFGDFILIAETIQTLIENGIIKEGIIVSHLEDLDGLLDAHSGITVLYPTRRLKDACRLVGLLFRKNIFVLHDMPSFNPLTRELRAILAIAFTRMPGSSLLILLDKDFKKSWSTYITSLFTKKTLPFDKQTKKHISQYMLDLLTDANITPALICSYAAIPLIKQPSILLPKQYIAVHPFAGGQGKTPAIQEWKDLLLKIRDISPEITIVITGGPKDFDSAKEITKDINNTLILCGKLSFKETLFVFTQSLYMVGIDTGPSHYAALHKVKQVLIWMQPNYTYMPTYNENALIVSGGTFIQAPHSYSGILKISQQFSVDTCLKAISSLVGK
jgi:ADP-heptose:LPS heptosyltransferase